MRRREAIAASTLIQCSWRRFKQREAFFGALVAAISLQALFRGRVVRTKMKALNDACRLVQWRWRTHLSIVKEIALATQIQRIFRGYRSRIKYEFSLWAAIMIQKTCRGTLTRRDFSRNAFAATIIQTAWRKFHAQLNFQLDLLEIIITQSAVRRHQAILEASRRRYAVITIQKAMRRCFAMHYLKLLRAKEHHRERVVQAVVVTQVSGCCNIFPSCFCAF